MRHGSKGNTCAAVLCAIVFCFSCAAAQTSLQQALERATRQVAAPAPDDAAVPPSTNVVSALQQIAGLAGVIFTGSITAVEIEATGGARVSFAVERGVRGVASGSAYTVRLSPWADGADRYHTGDRALFLLTRPSVSGYSAPVMGEHGVVPLTGDALVGNLDLRWIAVDVQRPSQQADRAAGGVRASSASNMASTSAEAARSAAATLTTVGNVAASTPDVHAIDRDLVLDLLRTPATATGKAY